MRVGEPDANVATVSMSVLPSADKKKCESRSNSVGMCSVKTARFATAPVLTMKIESVPLNCRLKHARVPGVIVAPGFVAVQEEAKLCCASDSSARRAAAVADVAGRSTIFICGSAYASGLPTAWVFHR